MINTEEKIKEIKEKKELFVQNSIREKITPFLAISVSTSLFVSVSGAIITYVSPEVISFFHSIPKEYISTINTFVSATTGLIGTKIIYRKPSKMLKEISAAKNEKERTKEILRLEIEKQILEFPGLMNTEESEKMIAKEVLSSHVNHLKKSSISNSVMSTFPTATSCFLICLLIRFRIFVFSFRSHLFQLEHI